MSITISYFGKGVTNTTPEREVTLQEVFSIIKDNEELKRDTNILRSTADEQTRRKVKTTRFPSVTFSGTFSYKQDDKLTKHSNLLCLDFDHVGNAEKIQDVRQKLIADPYIDTSILFTSPSGDGVKWVVRIDTDSHSHLDHFLSIENYLRSIYGLEIDKQCKNVSRSCFLCHDPQVIIINKPTKKGLDVDFWRPKKPVKDNFPKIDLVDQGDFDLIVNAIIEQRTDITNDYGDWFRIGCAIVSCKGEYGRDAFHLISKLSEKYNEFIADRQYDACLRCRGDISFGTLIHIARNNGVILPNITSKTSITSLTSEDVFEGNEGIEGEASQLTLPFIRDVVNHGGFPAVIKGILNYASSDKEYDVLLMGSLVFIGATLSRIYGIYGRHKYYPFLNYFLVAPAASGKSTLSACLNLIAPIHERYGVIYKEQLKEYNANKSNGDDSILPPRRRSLLIPANNSSAGFIQMLYDNDGIGVQYVPEADALADAWNGADYQNYNTLWRQAWGHELTTSYRKGDDTLVELRPRLASVISGTEGQVKRLIQSNENGLHSRFQYYYMNRDSQWHNPFSEDDDEDVILEDVFKKFGIEYMSLYDKLQSKESESVFHITKDQKLKFNQYFESQKEYYYQIYGGDMDSSVHRMGVCCFRIAMILSSIRCLYSGEIPDDIYCEDMDFENALSICKVLIKHTDYVSGFLDNASSECKNDRSFTAQRLYELLPQDSFSYSEAVTLAQKHGVSRATGERLVKQMRLDDLIEKIAHGKYQKKK